MTTNPLDAIQARADAFAGRGTPGRNAPEDRAVLLKAVRAVEEVHHPVQFSAKRFICGHCQYEPRTVISWPCPTITAIREALG